MAADTAAPATPWADVAALRVSKAVAKVARDLFPSVVIVQAHKSTPPAMGGGNQELRYESFGTGVVVDKSGLILTSRHVVDKAARIEVTLQGQAPVAAHFIGSDAASDLALLKLPDPPANLRPARLGDSDSAEIGETLVAIGAAYEFSLTVSSGLLSGRGKVPGLGPGEFLLTDAGIHPGGSGGALVNLYGEVIGISVALRSHALSPAAFGFAVPINSARRVMEDLLTEGRAARGYVGLFLQPLDENLRAHLGYKGLDGALVSKVLEGSPAALAGILPKDIVLALEGQRVSGVSQLRELIAGLDPGRSVKLQLWRAGAELVAELVAARRDEEGVYWPPYPPRAENFGMRLDTVNPELVQKYRLAVERGLVVTAIAPGSAAELGGLKEGDVILEVNDVPVTSIQEVAKLSPGPRNLLLILRGGAELYRAVSR